MTSFLNILGNTFFAVAALSAFFVLIFAGRELVQLIQRASSNPLIRNCLLPGVAFLQVGAFLSALSMVLEPRHLVPEAVPFFMVLAVLMALFLVFDVMFQGTRKAS